jgi:hypothetical protein
LADSNAASIAPPGRCRGLEPDARRRKPYRSPPPDLGPLSGYAPARPPGCLPDQVGRTAAARAGSGRLPPGGPSRKPPASLWTGYQIYRLPTRAVTSAEISTAVRSTRWTYECAKRSHTSILTTPLIRLCDWHPRRGNGSNPVTRSVAHPAPLPQLSLPTVVSPSVPQLTTDSARTIRIAPATRRRRWRSGMPLLPASDRLNRSRGPGRSRRPRPDSRPGSSRVSTAAPPGNDGA